MASRKVLRAARPRRQEYSSATRRALMDSAAELFTERGYAGTSLDEVVAAARVTKGALYHHYSGKLDLFEHVVERAQQDAAKTITRELKKHKDPWERAQVGLRVFLQICQEPTYRRIVMQEAPVALGPERFGEVDRASAFGLVEKIVEDLLVDSQVEKGLRETFATIFYGAMRSAGAYVADAEDPETASENAEVVIGAVLLGLRGFGGLDAALGQTVGDGEGPSGSG
ncbi:MAG: TetR/AcrR family transcriptional regulator [Nocardioidaceae bacterium]